MALSDNISDNLKGAALMAGAMSAFTFNDIFLKLLAGAVPLSQVIVLRSIMVSLAFAGLGLWLGGLRKRLSRRDWSILLLRSVAEGGAAYCFLTALFNMEIGSLSAILQALPLTVTLGAALAFGEPVGWRRITAIATGFIGVLMIIRPGTADFTVFAFYGLGAVVFSTVRDLATRRLSTEVPSMTAALAAAVVVAAMGAAMSWSDAPWVAPDPGQILLIAAAAALICLAYLAIVMAMRVGEVGFVAPFRYTSLVVAVLAGVILFGERPGPVTLLGMAIVVGSGLYTLWRERQLRRRIAARAANRGAMP